MTLTVHEMCFLSAAAGWLIAAAVFWLFGWYSKDVHRMSLDELDLFLRELRKELDARGEFVQLTDAGRDFVRHTGGTGAENRAADIASKYGDEQGSDLHPHGRPDDVA
jgi:hypothetical protein